MGKFVALLFMIIGFIAISIVIDIIYGVNIFTPLKWLGACFDWFNGVLDSALYFAYDYEKFGLRSYMLRLFLLFAGINYGLEIVEKYLMKLQKVISNNQGDTKI